MHSKIGFSVAALALIAGCASTDTNQAAASSDPATAKICEREYRVGSNIPTRDCRAAITEEERQRSIEDVRNAVRPAAPKVLSGSGG